MKKFMCRVAIILYFSTITHVLIALSAPSKKPQTLIIICMAARNELSIFAPKTLQQLQKIGTNDTVKIFVRFDFQKNKQPCITQHFFIDKNQLIQHGSDLSMESGDPQSFIYTIECAYEKFPADDVILILWGHGTGPIEPDVHKIMPAPELFRYNAKKNTLEINRSIRYLDYISRGETAYDETKGICFDDASGSYLTLEKLTHVLHTTTRIIKKKIKMLACDACMMAGVDVFIGFEPYVDYFIGSQEAENGTGYSYDLLLEPLLNGTMIPDAAFARHFVSAYKAAYGKINPDYTHAAIDLSSVTELENALDKLATLLKWGLIEQKGKTFREALRLSRHKNNCTSFLEPSFIDLCHFCANLKKNVSKCELMDGAATNDFKRELKQHLEYIKKIVGRCVIANAVGKNVQQATGVSIYFPEYLIHKSYYKNVFACRTHWLDFLKQYMATR